MNQTIRYYNQNVDQFFDTTYGVDMTSLYQSFLRYLPEHALILDLGCGSGRDTLAFKNLGYQVEAIDYSEELVRKACQFTGLPVKLGNFYELSAQGKYDAIWACASLLHCERDKLSDVLQRILSALKPNGICYISFKYGDQNHEKDGRSFTDVNEKQAHDLLKGFDDMLLLQQWITTDKRPDCIEEWLNILLKKQKA